MPDLSAIFKVWLILWLCGFLAQFLSFVLDLSRGPNAATMTSAIIATFMVGLFILFINL